MRAGLKGALGFAQQERDRLRGLVRRLHPEHELEVLAARVVPGETAFRLEKHRIDGLGLEFAVQHQQAGLLAGKLGADLLAVGRGLGVGRPGLRRERRPDRKRRVLDVPGLTQPSWSGE